MSDSPTEKERCLINDEIKIVSDVIGSLKEQQKKVNSRLTREQDRARELTAGLVNATRDEEKAMLASDEAVSHALRDNHDETSKNLNNLIENPYFARFEVEEDANGKPVKREYRLGFAANPECRIIDWRKAPVSKLYYEYKEGDEYFEEIQGREREGKVLLRNSVEIKKQTLTSLTCRHGSFRLQQSENGNSWVKADAGLKSSGTLKEILSLITAEQFQTITEDARTAILIQGIAGSGKTTVALHRLAWLLHEDNSDLQAEDCVVIVLSEVLKRYLSGLLPSIDIHGVKVLTFSEWCKKTISLHFTQYMSEQEINRNPKAVSYSIARLKNSFAYLTLFEKADHTQPLHQVNLSILERDKEILALDDSRLLTQELIREVHARERENADGGFIDKVDEALLLRSLQLRHVDRKLGHIVVDEVQDYSPVQLAMLIDSVRSAENLTLVGDTSQQIHSYDTFPGWEKLRSRWAFKEDLSKYISLTVSHRSTLPIMKLADHVQGKSTVTEGRAGRVPIYFKCPNEEDGIARIIEWLKTAVTKYPNAVTAVLCHDDSAAKGAFKLLEPTFGAAVRFGRKHSFTFEEGIIVSSAATVKGLEFTNVLLWNPSFQSYPKTQLGKNLLYVAITRAEENLALALWDRPSAHLPHIHSKKVRGYDFTEPEEEQAVRHPR